MSSDKSRIYFFEKQEVFLKKIRTGFGIWGRGLGMIVGTYRIHPKNGQWSTR